MNLTQFEVFSDRVEELHRPVGHVVPALPSRRRRSEGSSSRKANPQRGLVGVPVMQVGEVPVRVLQPSMAVGMGVPRRRGQPRMGVVVVPVVVAVAMDVLQGFVDVRVLVLVDQQQGDPGEQQCCCGRMSPEDRLSQEEERQTGPEEGRAGEGDLRPRCAEVLGREDVEQDARPVR